MVTPPRQLLALPSDYIPGERMYYVSWPFLLNPDPYPEAGKPTSAKGNVLAMQKGSFIPYLVIGDNLQVDSSQRLRYANMVAGTPGDVNLTTYRSATRYDFGDKIRGRLDPNPSEAYHHLGRKPLGTENLFPRIRKRINHHRHEVVGVRIRKRYSPQLEPEGFATINELTQAQYNTLNYRDNFYVVTNDRAKTQNQIYAAKENVIVPEPLYDGRDLEEDARLLSWDKDTNSWFWYAIDDNSFVPLAADEGAVLKGSNYIDVAGGVDPNNGVIYALISQVRHSVSPSGYFQVWHQLVAWDPDSDDSYEGAWWKSLEAKEYNWPPQVIVPTKLEIYNDKVYVITEMDPGRLDSKGLTYTNYYGSRSTIEQRPKGDYQWLPFGQLYAERQLDSENRVEFATFNPGVVSTVHTINLEDEWVPKGPAKFVRGVYDPAANRFANMAQAAIDTFEGTNNKVYAGRIDNTLYWYQAFLPYNGAEALEKKMYRSNSWMQYNAAPAWHGIVTYNLETSESTQITSDLPFVVNPGATIDQENLVISGGVELIEQFFNNDYELLVSPPAEPSTNPLTRKAFWVEPDVQGVRRRSQNPAGFLNTSGVAINVQTAAWERFDSSVEETSATGDDVPTHIPLMIASSAGWAKVGGKEIVGRKRTRARRSDRWRRRHGRMRRGIINGARAHQIYIWRGLTLNPEDLVKVHVRAQSDGRQWSDKQDRDDLEAPDYYCQFHNGSEWQLMQLLEGQRIGDDEKIFGFRVGQTNLDLELEDELMVAVSSSFLSRQRSNLPSKVRVDYVYLTVESVAHDHQYTWENLPQGGQGAVVVECWNDEKVDLGVEIKTIKLDIDSSK